MVEDAYSRISVTSDEDDDIVIQAGVRTGTESGKAELEPEHGVDLQRAPEQRAPKLDQAADGGDAPAAPRMLSERDAEILSQAADDESRQAYLRHVRERERRRRVQGMETTEDDLHAKMPFAKMQIAIVAVLLVLLGAALVYWFVLR